MKKFHSALFDFCWFPNYDASIEYLVNKFNLSKIVYIMI